MRPIFLGSYIVTNLEKYYGISRKINEIFEWGSIGCGTRSAGSFERSLLDFSVFPDPVAARRLAAALQSMRNSKIALFYRFTPRTSSATGQFGCKGNSTVEFNFVWKLQQTDQFTLTLFEFPTKETKTDFRFMKI